MLGDSIENGAAILPEPDKPTGRPKATMKAKATKKAAKRATGKPKADRTNKKGELIALMKRAKGATLAEITAATKWRAHTIRGFVSILGSKDDERIESSKGADGKRTYKPLPAPAGVAFPACECRIAHPV